MNQLGVVYRRMREFDKSVRLYEELLKLREAKLGRDHVQNGWAFYEPGRTTGTPLGCLKEAIVLLEEAQQQGEETSQTRMGDTGIAGCLRKGRRERQARRIAPAATVEVAKRRSRTASNCRHRRRSWVRALSSRRNGARPNRSSASAWEFARRYRPICGPRSTPSRYSAAPCWARKNMPRPTTLCGTATTE